MEAAAHGLGRVRCYPENQPVNIYDHVSTSYMYLASIGSWGGETFAYHRARILKQLRESNAHHLVIVRYRPDHDPNYEWVYNEADIDGAQVVWAREMWPIRKLLEYFTGRAVWLLEADAVPPILVPYPVQ